MAKDIVLDEFDVPLVVNGDFVVEDTEFQHQKHIVLAEAGDIREYPVCGVGIRRYRNGNFLQGSGNLKSKIQLQLELDGYRVDTVRIPNNADNQLLILAYRL